MLYRFRLGMSHQRLNQREAAIYPFEQALLAMKKKEENRTVPRAVLLLNLARSQGATGNVDGVIKALTAIAATGARPYSSVINSRDFSEFLSNPEFLIALSQLQPCTTTEHRAFDFWIGEWDVSSPTNKSWHAKSFITLGNDGSSIHEDYTSMGGYAGRSINFYDAAKEQWYQTRIDNQGQTLFLPGNFVDGAMVLQDKSNRITWSNLRDDKFRDDQFRDDRVRQHWESTTAGGQSWTTAFEGYYQRHETRAEN